MKLSSRTCSKSIAFVLIGIPGSGKSTLARDILAKMPQNSKILSLDTCRYLVNGDEGDNSNFGQVKTLFYRHLDKAAHDGIDVVIDNTNARPSYRKGIINDLKKRGWQEVIGIYVPCSVEQSMVNQQFRTRKVSYDVVAKMSDLLQKYPPCKEEGFDYLVEIITKRDIIEV